MVKFREKILLAQLQQKDKDAFSKTYDLYVDQIYRFIYFKVGNKEEAEDLTSAVFLKTWNYAQGDEASHFSTLKPLLYKIARTTVIDHYRKKGRQQGDVSIDNELRPIDVVDNTQNLHKQVEISSDMREVEAKLLELKDEYREVVILRYLDELSISEIAKIMEKSKGNIRILSYRALKALRELF